MFTLRIQLEHESEGGRTKLMKTARAGHLCTVQFLISRGADVNKQTTNNDHTSLSLACAGGHLNVVEVLLQQGADPYHKLKDNSTMLIEAAKGGHTNVVQILIDYPNSLVTSGIMEAAAAAQLIGLIQPGDHVVDLDSETDSNNNTALTLACAGGHEELVNLLLSRGADIEHRDKKGFSPLILAATAGHDKVTALIYNHYFYFSYS